MVNKTSINSYKALAVNHQKNVDLEKYLALEGYQVLCQFYGELRRVDGEVQYLIYLKCKFPCSTKCVQNWVFFVYPIENNFIQSLSNMEFHVIFVQLGTNIPR